MEQPTAALRRLLEDEAFVFLPVPLVYVLSRGNRDGRSVPAGAQLAEMGYKVAIDAVTCLLVSFHYAKQAYAEIMRTGNYAAFSPQDWIDARKEIEDIVGHDEFYRIEEETVEKHQPADPA